MFLSLSICPLPLQGKIKKYAKIKMYKAKSNCIKDSIYIERKLNVPPVVTVLTPPFVQCDPSVYLENRLDTLEKKQFFEYNEIVEGAGM